tara:strand:+ start:9697 stop:10011 length:315 start_codon:yes stop_codon:yes gene_type:complete
MPSINKETQSRLVFLIDKDLHDQFRAACAEDGLSQAKFVTGIVKAYVEKNRSIIREVEKIRGSSKLDAKQRLKNLANETIKEFEFDDNEIENIFDKIEEANPDL